MQAMTIKRKIATRNRKARKERFFRTGPFSGALSVDDFSSAMFAPIDSDGLGAEGAADDPKLQMFNLERTFNVSHEWGRVQARDGIRIFVPNACLRCTLAAPWFVIAFFVFRFLLF